MTTKLTDYDGNELNAEQSYSYKIGSKSEVSILKIGRMCSASITLYSSDTGALTAWQTWKRTVITDSDVRPYRGYSLLPITNGDFDISKRPTITLREDGELWLNPGNKAIASSDNNSVSVIFNYISKA